MTETIHVENIRCGGCANTITKKLSALDGVDAVDVNIEDQLISFEGSADQLDAVIATLKKLGYPQAGSVEGIEALTTKAKSVASCAVGKLG